MPKAKRLKKGVIKKGTPHPKYPSYKFDGAHLTDKQANERDSELMGQPNVKDIRRVGIPRPSRCPRSI